MRAEHMAPKRAFRNRGFTLVEILVALVVLSIAAVSLLQSFAGGLRASDSARQQSYAMLLAQSKMAVVGVELPLTPGTVDGRFDERFTWQVTIAPDALSPDAEPELAGGTGGGGSPGEVMNVTVTVSWPAGNPRSSINLTSARLDQGIQGNIP